MALVYDYRADYKNNLNIEKVGEGHAKYEQCMFVVHEIMSILNANKYNDFEDFFKKNNSLQDFLKNNPRIQAALKHVNTFGNPINEEDYAKIKDTIKNITEAKKSFETDKIKTSNIDKNQYNALNIDEENHYIDNSDSDKSIKEQMKDIQSTQSDFQTVDAKKNTENMFKEIEKKKESINFVRIPEINYDLLNNEEKELLRFAIDYQLSSPSLIKVDIKKGLMVDEENNIMKISKENGELKIINEKNDYEKTENKSYQKQYKPNKDTIYSN